MPESAVAVREESAIVPVKERVNRYRDQLALLAPQIASTLPNGMSADRFQTVVLQTLTKNADLLDCDAASVVASVLEAAQLGLEPTGSLSRAWLVPVRVKGEAKKHAQLRIGARGYEDLARRSGSVKDIYSRVVYKGDEFGILQGTEEGLRHIPSFESDLPGDITHVYAVVRFTDGAVRFEVMTKKQVDGIRARAPGANSGPWVTDYGEMARKTVVRRIAKTLELTAEARDAIERDEDREFGGSPEPTVRISRTAELREQLAARVSHAPEAAADEAPLPEPPASASSATPQTIAAPGPSGAVAAPDEPAAVIEGPAADVKVVDRVPRPDEVQAEYREEAEPHVYQERTMKATVVGGPDRRGERELCGAKSPYGNGTTCTLPRHQAGVLHRNGGKETWR